MRWLYGIIGILLILALMVACTMETNTEQAPAEDIEGLNDVDALDSELDADLDTEELDQLIEDLDSY